MPSASVSTATAVKPGFFSNWRKANLKSFMVRGQWSVVRCHLFFYSAFRAPRSEFGSFITQRLHRIDSRRPARRQPASEDRDNKERCGSQKEHRRIPRRNAEQKTLHQSCPAQRQHESGN